MPQITVWQCPRTGKIVQGKSAYMDYLKATATDNRRTKARNRLAENHVSWFANARETLYTPEDIAEFVVDNYERLVAAYVATCPRFGGEESLPVVTSVKFPKLKWKQSVSNSHSCPRDGVKNWHGVDDKPRGYPGYYGSIEFDTGRGTSMDSDFFGFLGINTGSGGGGACADGHREYRYGVSLFASDWEGLASETTAKILSGELSVTTA